MTVEEDRLDVIRALADALDAAYTELVQLDEIELPLTDRVEALLREHGAMKRTLTRLIEASPVPAAARASAEGVYAEEIARATSGSENGGGVPVDAGVLVAVVDVYELLRRRRIGDRALDDAMRDFVPVADCGEF